MRNLHNLIAHEILFIYSITVNKSFNSISIPITENLGLQIAALDCSMNQYISQTGFQTTQFIFSLLTKLSCTM